MHPVPANILIIAIIGIVSYLLGSIPTGVIIGKVFFHKDLRQYGSKNSGGTNAGRVFGKKIGILVIILDMIKTIIPFYLSWALLTYVPYLRDVTHWSNGYNAAPAYYWGSVLFASIGHCWSIFLRFNGGKAVSCYMGAVVLTSWIEFCCAGFTFLGVAKKSKIISISSMTAATVGTITSWVIAIIAVAVPWNPYVLTWLFTIPEAPFLGIEFAIVNTIVSGILVLRHSSNIKRLAQGTESISPFAKNSGK